MATPAAFVCVRCADEERHYDRARSAARYDGVLGRMVYGFKYQQALWLEPDLTDLLAQVVSVHYADVEPDAVCAVPLFHARQRERGYNQAALLGRALARRIDRPFWPGTLRRIRPTETQTHLTARERAHNVKGAFSCREANRVRGCRILLVDDVMTTGSTMNECARALKKAGAAAVYLATVARGG